MRQWRKQKRKSKIILDFPFCFAIIAQKGALIRNRLTAIWEIITDVWQIIMHSVKHNYQVQNEKLQFLK